MKVHFLKIISRRYNWRLKADPVRNPVVVLLGQPVNILSICAYSK